MPNRFRNHPIASIGLACCAILTAFTTLNLWLNGPYRDVADGPLGMLLRLLAARFTNAPSVLNAGSDREDLVQTLHLAIDIPLLCAFSAMFWRSTRDGGLGTRARLNVLLLAQLLIAAFVDSSFLFLFAAELALVVPLRTGLKWLGAQILLTLAVRVFNGWASGEHDSEILKRLLGLCMETGFYFLAFGVACVAVLEQRARTRLAAANAELSATQGLLADTVRASERLRIARELHDHVGHHLTALNLHLDLAQRQADGPVQELVGVSRELSQALLAEVRRVVVQERDDHPIALAQALATLCAGVPRPPVRLTLEEPLVVASPATAHAIFRCVQEGLSNAIRHAGATAIQVSVECQGDDVVVRVSDDGAGNPGRPEGSGLRGMRERLAAANGTLVAANRVPRGFAVEARLPLAGAAR
jgi:two-component system, NarL family, sensor histidine kinase DesK